MNKVILANLAIIGTGLLVLTGVFFSQPVYTGKTQGCIIIKGDIDPAMVFSVQTQYEALADKNNVCVKIETDGGLVNSAIDIILFLDAHTKTTTMIVERYAHSAGAFIMLSGTYLQMAPTATSVIHVPRLGYYEGHVVIDPEYNIVFNKAFLNEGRGARALGKHLEDYLSGKDVWLTGVDIINNYRDLSYASYLNKKVTHYDTFRFLLTY